MQPEVESGSFATGAVSRLLERLAYQVNAALHNHGEESIHELRVAVRRFNQSLALFKDLYPGKERKKIRRKLKNILHLTSDVRDCDVAAELLTDSELAGAEALRKPLAERRKDAVRMLMPALRGWSSGRTTAKWRAALTPNGASHTPLSEIVQDRLPRIGKRFFKQADDASDANDLHHARILGKKLRYSLELLQPAYNGKTDAAIEQLRTFQSLLGKAHDAHAIRLLVTDLRGDSEIEAWMKKREKKKIREFHDAWRQSSDALRDALQTLKTVTRKPVARAGRAAAAKPKTRIA